MTNRTCTIRQDLGTKLIRSLVFSTLITLIVAHAPAQTHYKFIGLGTRQIPVGINSSGQVAVYAGNQPPYIWQNGQVTPLGGLPAGLGVTASAVPAGINDNGQIAFNYCCPGQAA